MNLKPTSSSLLISLSTYPDFHTDDFLNSIVSNLDRIKNKRKKMYEILNDDYDCYFEPLIYTLWGFWDLGVLVVSDNSEIITEVLQPEMKPPYVPEGQISSKIYSGISFKGIGKDLSEINKIAKTEYYPLIGIANLKFSGKWLLPNGQDLVYKFLDYVNSLFISDFKDMVCFPVYTFNTYEMSMVVLGDDLQRICDAIFKIRELKVSDIPGIKVGRLKKIKEKGLKEDQSHLFIDSQSHFGARLLKKESTSKKNKIPFWDLSPNVNFKGVKAVFEIEAKPGHSKDLEYALDKVIPDNLQPVKEMYFQAGLYDFYLNWNFDSDVFKVIFNTLKDKNSQLRRHIRKFKTRFLFEYSPALQLSKKQEINFDFQHFDLERINNSLKAIKVSKSLRSQIVKIFYSFQNSLMNKITFCAFIDLYYFVKKLEEEIYTIERFVQGFFKSIPDQSYEVLTVQNIENQLGAYVSTYKDSYYLRYVNDRSIVDVQDFLIPHNTQLQTVIGFYDSYVKSIISVLKGPEFGNSFILTFDEHITEVNPISIKLLSNNLFEPGLIFTALSKEIPTICAYSHPNDNDNLNTLNGYSA